MERSTDATPDSGNGTDEEQPLKMLYVDDPHDVPEGWQFAGEVSNPDGSGRYGVYTRGKNGDPFPGSPSTTKVKSNINY